MKVSKEERALLSKIIQEEFIRVRLANRAEKNKVKSEHRENKPGFLRRLASWRWSRDRNKEEATPIVKAASAAK